MKISVVIPMYNEASIVQDAVRTLDRAMASYFNEGEYELIFVSDGSTDDCAAKAEALCGDIPALRVLQYTPNRGKGCAVRTGMLASKGDFVLFTDCDLAYGTEMIYTFYQRFLESGADVVIGSRAIGDGYDGYPFLRKLMSKGYLKLVSLLAGFKHSDSQTGIKGFSGQAAKLVFSECEEDGFAFDLEALMEADRQNLSVEEVAVKVINHRESKIRPIHDTVTMMRQVFVIRKREKQKRKAMKS